MKNEFVPYDIALAMTQVGWGWHEGVMGWYCNTTQELRRDDNLPVGVIYAPLYQQAFRWFRDKYNIDCRFHTYTHFREGVRTDFMWDYIDGKKTSFDGYKNTLKEAQDACLRKLIEICSK